MHQADRLVGAAAAGAGDAGDGDHDIGIGLAERAARHGLGRLAADRAELFQRVCAGTPSICCLASFE